MEVPDRIDSYLKLIVRAIFYRMNMIGDITFGSELEEFRNEARQWLLDNCPTELRGAKKGSDARCWGGKKWHFDSPAQKLWLERCVSKGWTVPHWPIAYGGAGLTTEHRDILKAEMEDLEIPTPLYSYGMTMLGPTLLKFGTEAQKAKHLPPIARGEMRWCQGYSEPNAGSDLASLTLKCEDQGDHWLLNGQKVWTSTADESDSIFTIVRTNNQLNRKHDGITFLLVDLNTQGIEVRPIDLISGKSPFCEVFFSDVKVPKLNGPDNPSVVGEVDDGWKVGMYLLSHERGSLGSYTLEGRGHERPLIETAIETVGLNELGTLDNPILRANIAEAQIDEAACIALAEHLNAKIHAGEEIGARSSLVKYASTKIIQRGYELRMDIAGLSGISDTVSEDENVTTLAQNWLYSRTYTIMGGTSEIQLNIISKRLLGLPTS